MAKSNSGGTSHDQNAAPGTLRRVFPRDDFPMRWGVMAMTLVAFCAGVFIARRYDIATFRWAPFFIIVGFCLDAAIRGRKRLTHG